MATENDTDTGIASSFRNKGPSKSCLSIETSSPDNSMAMDKGIASSFRKKGPSKSGLSNGPSSPRDNQQAFDHTGPSQKSLSSGVSGMSSRLSFAHNTNFPEGTKMNSMSSLRHQKLAGEVRLHHMRKEIIEQHKSGTSDSKPYMSIADSFIFRTLIMAMTVLNTLQMGLEVDYPEWSQSWKFCENFFTAVFTIEMIIKLRAEKLRYFCDKANLLDGGLTVLGIIDVWVLGLLVGARGGTMQSLSMLRILRLMRIARVLRFVRRVKPLVLVLKGVAQAIMSSVYVLAVVIFSLYVFAVLLTPDLGKQKGDMYPGYSTEEEVIDTQEVMENYNPHIYWGNMLSSMITLFNLATFTEWAELIRPIALKEPWYLPVFMLYATCVGFGLMNVLVGVIVDVVFAESKRLEAESNEKLKNEKLSSLDKIQDELELIDKNGNGMLDLEELSRGVKESETLMRLFAQINLPLGWSTTDLLDMLDDSGDGMLAHTEFTTSFFRLLDSDHFQQMCIMRAGLNQVKQLLFDQTQHFGERLATIKTDLNTIKSALGIARLGQSQVVRSSGSKPGKPALKRQRTSLEIKGKSAAGFDQDHAKADKQTHTSTSPPAVAVDDVSSTGADLISRMQLIVQECIRQEFEPVKHSLSSGASKNSLSSGASKQSLVSAASHSRPESSDFGLEHNSCDALRSHATRPEGAPMIGSADVASAIANRPERSEWKASPSMPEQVQDAESTPIVRFASGEMILPADDDSNSDCEIKMTAEDDSVSDFDINSQASSVIKRPISL